MLEEEECERQFDDILIFLADDVLPEWQKIDSLETYFAEERREDADAVNEDICSIINSWRCTSGPPRLLVFHAIGLAKIAVQHGLDITIDTMDCPQALIRSVPMDYSHLDLSRPKYGFPWEK